MEPFTTTPYINPAVLTSLPIPVLRKEGERRQQEVKLCENLAFDGRNLEQTYYVAQSDKAIQRSLRKGIGSTTLRLRPIGDKITIEFNKSVRIELSLPQVPRQILLHNKDHDHLLTDQQHRKRAYEQLFFAGEGGYREPRLPPPPPSAPPPPYTQPPTRSAAAATATKEATSPEVTIVEERETIVLEERNNIVVGNCTGQVEEILGEVTETIAGPGNPKKKRNNKKSEGPVTRASNKRVVLTKREKTLAEQQKLEEYHEIQANLRDFRRVHAEVARQATEDTKAAESGTLLDEIPQLTIREIVSVNQNDFDSYEEICPGDIPEV